MVLSGLLAAGHVSAAEPQVSAQAIALTPTGDHGLIVSSPGARGHGTWRFRLAADYTREPLVLLDEQQNIHRIVVEQLWTHAGASLALDHRLLFGADVGFMPNETGEPPPVGSGLAEAGGAALGDPRLFARARVLGEPRSVEFGAGVEVWLPLATSAYAGDDGFRLRPSLAVGHDERTFFWSVNLGYLFRPSQTLPGVLPTRVGSALSPAVGCGVALDSVGDWIIGPELAALLTVGNGASLFDPRSSDISLLIHGRHRLLGGPLELGAAFGPSLGQLPGAADYRALLTVTFSPEAPPPLPDGDEDSVPDESDMCPSLKGVPSNDPLMSGCPELPTESDGDGIPDIYDACPQTPGIATGDKRTHGCPPAQDTDRDGFIDLDDACRDLPGLASSDPKKNGCPPPPKAELVERQIVISQQVTFETGTAILRPESDSILSEVAEVLKEHPELSLVEVAGHTDDTGSPELNQHLSQDRAQSVVDWLVRRGVEAKRLRAKGYGQSKPIADNTSEEGRARNRRVEFHSIEEKGGGQP